MGFRCPAGLCVPKDAIVAGGPELQAAVAESETILVLSFDRPLLPDAVQDVRNYVLEPRLGVRRALMSDPQTVVLTLESQTPGQAYIIRVQNLRGYSGAAIPTQASRATFVGFGTPPDAAPPTPLFPDRGSVQYLGDVGPVTVGWSPRRGASTYTIELDDEPTFAPPLVWRGSVDAPATSIETFNALRPVTYYWRVRADVTHPEQWGYSSFERLTSVIHVYCAEDAIERDPAGEPVLDDNGEAIPAECPPPSQELDDPRTPAAIESGNRTTPYRSIQRGIEAAQSLGLSEVRLANHGGSRGYYAENIQLREGVSLHGGYDRTFENRSLQNPTRIVGVGITVLAADIRADTQFAPPTIVDNLSIETRTDTFGGTGQLATGMRIIGCDEALRIQNTRILATNSQGCVGLDVRLYSYLKLEAAPQLVDSVVEVVPTPDIGFGPAVQIEAAVLRVENSTIIGDTPGIRFRQGLLHVRDSTITTQRGTAIEVLDGTSGFSSKLDIADSRIRSSEGVSPGGGAGILLSEHDCAHVKRNEIFVGPASMQKGVHVEGGPLSHSATLLYNNVVVLTEAREQANTTSVGLSIHNASASVAHNTVVVAGGRGPQGTALGIALEGISNPWLYNNLFYIHTGEPIYFYQENNRSGSVESPSYDNAAAMQGNVFATPAWDDLAADGLQLPAYLYWDADAEVKWSDGTTKANTSNAPDALDGTSTCKKASRDTIGTLSCDELAATAGDDNTRFETTLDALFVNATGPDGKVSVGEDANFRLASGDLDIAEAGRDLFDTASGAPVPASNCGAQSEMASCPLITEDADANSRTLPVTPGAYETN